MHKCTGLIPSSNDMITAFTDSAKELESRTVNEDIIIIKNKSNNEWNIILAILKKRYLVITFVYFFKLYNLIRY